MILHTLLMLELKCILHDLSQYHGGWCPGSFRHQGITHHDIEYKLLLVFHKEGYQLPLPSQHWETKEHTNLSLCFPKFIVDIN